MKPSREFVLMVCNNIKTELADGIHTFSMCKCGRRGCRTAKCAYCWIQDLEEKVR